MKKPRFPVWVERFMAGGPLHQRSGKDFRAYQDWMTEKCEEIPHIILAAEMGLGKTGAVLRAIVRLLWRQQIKRVLIVAPINVANDTWPEEIETWDFSRHLGYSVLTGDEESRLAAAKVDVPIHIINRENLVWLYRLYKQRRKPWPYDVLVYDEASRLKGAKQRTAGNLRADGTKSPKKMSGFGATVAIRRQSQRSILMTGTPTPNGLIDLWGPSYICDLGERLGINKTAYEERWFWKDLDRRLLVPKSHAEREIMDAMSDVMFSLKEEDYLNLPPLVSSERYITLSPEHMKTYRRLENEFILEEHDIEAVNSGVLTSKLLQLSNGSIYDSEGNDVYFHDQKLDELESIFTEANGEPILVAYSFKFDLTRIKKRFPKWRLYGETKNDLRDWNAGRLEAMIVHPASAAHGLNFQYGGRIAVWYGLTWSAELYRQFIKRLHRSGQKADRVLLHHILARNTHDERVMKVLRERRATEDRITDLVRVRWERVQRELRLAA